MFWLLLKRVGVSIPFISDNLLTHFDILLYRNKLKNQKASNCLYKAFYWFFLWSESHISYELCSISRNIIYKFLLSFNENMDNFVII
jgi:hypothetical protein